MFSSDHLFFVYYIFSVANLYFQCYKFMLLHYCKFMLFLIYLFLYHFQRGGSSFNYYSVQIVKYIFQ